MRLDATKDRFAHYYADVRLDGEPVKYALALDDEEGTVTVWLKDQQKFGEPEKTEIRRGKVTICLNLKGELYQLEPVIDDDNTRAYDILNPDGTVVRRIRDNKKELLVFCMEQSR